MLAKDRRLNRKNFILVLKSSAWLRSAHCNLRFIKNSLGFSRFSVVVSKKVSPLAVRRNALKRQIFNQIASYSGSYDIIIYPKDENSLSEIDSLLSKIS